MRAGPMSAFCLGLAVVTAPLLAMAAEKQPERVVMVSASGTVSAEPDIAHIATGVVSEAETAREALSHNTAQMKAVIEGLRSAGIAAKDVQTISINIEPRYQTSKDGRPTAIAGYRVHNQVRITARDLARLGDVLDRAVTLGANQMGGISFEVGKAEALKDEARRQAMANARRRAELYAAAAGVELGQVMTIAEEVHGQGVRPITMARRGAAAEAVPIERGAQTLEVSVHVTWALK